jgi:hypothetical protein
MPCEQPPLAPTRISKPDVQDMVDVLFWVSRAARINGPAGTTAYFISDEHMNQARKIIADLKAADA